MSSNRIHIVIDTREQRPWSFKEWADVSRGTISAGDYALKGDKGFAIERKNLDDYVGTIFTGKARFNAELQRMIDLGFPARIVIVEADLSDIIEHRYNHPEIEPQAIIKRTAELILDGVVILFAKHPEMGAGFCWRLLKERKSRLEVDK